MNIGKEKCRLLRKIRSLIAKEYNLTYNPERCNHVGECSGTCPLCDAELKDLERQITETDKLFKYKEYKNESPFLTSFDKEIKAQSVEELREKALKEIRESDLTTVTNSIISYIDFLPAENPGTRGRFVK